MSAGALWMVTGPRQAGKSAFCQEMAETARRAGWDVAGLLSLAQIEQTARTGILTRDLRTGESHQLASASRQSQEDLVFGDWYFNRQTLAWGNRVLARSLPCDLFIVDELGPLEFNCQIGWQAALDILAGSQYRLALVVIRPELQTTACRLFDFSKIIEIDQTRTTDAWVRSLWSKIGEPS